MEKPLSPQLSSQTAATDYQVWHTGYGFSSHCNTQLAGTLPPGVRWPQQMVFSCCWGNKSLGPRFGIQGPPWSGPGKLWPHTLSTPGSSHPLWACPCSILCPARVTPSRTPWTASELVSPSLCPSAPCSLGLINPMVPLPNQADFQGRRRRGEGGGAELLEGGRKGGAVSCSSCLNLGFSTGPPAWHNTVLGKNIVKTK